MRLTLIIPSLGAGGAERVMTLLAQALAARGHEVSLLTLSGGEGEFFSGGAQVRRIRLNTTGDSRTAWEAVRANLARVQAIRRAVVASRPDAVLSFITTTNILAILACWRLPVRVVVSERVDPRQHRVGTSWEALRTLLYRQADVVVAQTADVAAWFRARLPATTQITAIPNPVILAEGESAELPVPRPFLLAAGRLVHQKGFDTLIRAFALLARARPDIHLAVAGEGPDAEALRNLVSELDLTDRVKLLGAIHGLPTLMKQAEAFVLSSRYEGFPNVLLEALASGLPVVAADCQSGPREILRDGEYGLLVPPQNPQALQDAMNRILTDARLRDHLRRLAPTAVAPYRIEPIVSAWERVLDRSR